jgi:hypothetical protein
MPGPLSAPNGDRQLVKMTAKERAILLAKKKLDTGKTRKKKGDLMPRKF